MVCILINIYLPATVLTVTISTCQILFSFFFSNSLLHKCVSFSLRLCVFVLVCFSHQALLDTPAAAAPTDSWN